MPNPTPDTVRVVHMLAPANRDQEYPVESSAVLAIGERSRLFREWLRERLRSMDRRERADFADAVNWYPEGEGEVLTDWERLVLAALCPEEAPCPTD